MIDLGKFLTILMLFEFGFSMFFVAMNQPYHAINEMSGSLDTSADILSQEGILLNLNISNELLS